MFSYYFSQSTVGTTNFHGIFVQYNNDIIVIPHNSNNLFFINTKNLSVHQMPNFTLSGQNKFHDQIIHNNKLYLIPYSHSSLVIYDLKQYKIEQSVGNISGNSKFINGVLVKDSNNEFRIFFIPYQYSNIMYYESQTNSIKSVPNFSNSQSGKWWGQILQSNNNIYQAPHNVNYMLEFNPFTFEYTYYYLPFSSSQSLFSSIIEFRNKLYLIPYSQKYLAIFDLNTKTFEFIGVPFDSQKWYTCFIYNNYLYQIPFNVKYLLELNLLNNFVNYYTINELPPSFGGVFVNNKLFINPQNTNNISVFELKKWKNNSLLYIDNKKNFESDLITNFNSSKNVYFSVTNSSLYFDNNKVSDNLSTNVIKPNTNIKFIQNIKQQINLIQQLNDFNDLHEQQFKITLENSEDSPINVTLTPNILYINDIINNDSTILFSEDNNTFSDTITVTLNQYEKKDIFIKIKYNC